MPAAPFEGNTCCLSCNFFCFLPKPTNEKGSSLKERPPGAERSAACKGKESQLSLLAGGIETHFSDLFPALPEGFMSPEPDACLFPLTASPWVIAFTPESYLTLMHERPNLRDSVSNCHLDIRHPQSSQVSELISTPPKPHSQFSILQGYHQCLQPPHQQPRDCCPLSAPEGQPVTKPCRTGLPLPWPPSSGASDRSPPIITIIFSLPPSSICCQREHFTTQI